MAVLYGVYAAVLLVGGVMGYAKAKSAPSLVAGIVAAVLMAVAAFLLPTHPKAALILGAFVSASLYVVFTRRYAKTRKVMPSVVMAIVSVLVLLATLFSMRPPHA